VYRILSPSKQCRKSTTATTDLLLKHQHFTTHLYFSSLFTSRVTQHVVVSLYMHTLLWVFPSAETAGSHIHILSLGT